MNKATEAYLEQSRGVFVEYFGAVDHLLAASLSDEGGTEVLRLVHRPEVRPVGGGLRKKRPEAAASSEALPEEAHESGRERTLKAMCSRTWVAPAVSSVSCLLPEPTKMPTQADCPGLFSVTTRNPLSRVVISVLQEAPMRVRRRERRSVAREGQRRLTLALPLASVDATPGSGIDIAVPSSAAEPNIDEREANDLLGARATLDVTTM